MPLRNETKKSCSPFALPLCCILAIILQQFSVFKWPLMFRDKQGILNQVFAKKSWLWTTLVFIHALWKSKYPKSRKKISIFRFLLATMYWFFMARWFFGDSIMDRINSYGSCSIDKSQKDCLKYGGKWSGHDVSGHCMILIHSYLFLHNEFVQLTKFIYLLSIIWIIILCVTIEYYHTSLEQISGIIMGTLFSALVYRRFWIK